MAATENLKLTVDLSTTATDTENDLPAHLAAANSNFKVIDDFAGNFSGGTKGQVYVKNAADDYSGEWQDIDNGGAVTVATTGDVSQTISPDKFYNFTGALTSLTITLGATVSGRENEYKGQFLSGDTAPTVTFPDSVSWVNGTPTIEANKTYQFSILNGIGVIVGV